MWKRCNKKIESRVTLEGGIRGLFSNDILAESETIFTYEYYFNEAHDINKSFREEEYNCCDVGLILSLGTVEFHTRRLLLYLQHAVDDKFSRVLTLKLQSITEFNNVSSWEDVNGFNGTCFALLVESVFHKKYPNSSPFKEYLSWLPQSSADLLSLTCWLENELEAIRETSVVHDLAEFMEASKKSYNENVNLERLPTLYKYLAEIGFSKDDLWEQYNYCATLVQSYSFTLQVSLDSREQETSSLVSIENAENSGDSSAAESTSIYSREINIMIPIMDAFNADTSKNNVRLFMMPSFDEDKKNKLVLACEAIKEVQANSELFNTFGELSANERLLKYGYLEPQDEYHLSFSHGDIFNAIKIVFGIDLSSEIGTLFLTNEDCNLLKQSIDNNLFKDFFKSSENTTLMEIYNAIIPQLKPKRKRTSSFSQLWKDFLNILFCTRRDSLSSSFKDKKNVSLLKNQLIDQVYDMEMKILEQLITTIA